MRNINLIIKRGFDIFASAVGLILLTPLFVIVTVAIHLDSKGSAFFLQKRVGKNRKVFSIFKFRTMTVNAEHMGMGLQISGENDSRITKIGRFLRSSSIDELPQLWNVLKGDMSLVGPRPPVTYYPYPIDGYDEIKVKRFDMRPGITGLAQVEKRNNGTWDERIEFDVQYVENFNAIFDFKILAATFFLVLRHSNVYRKADATKPVETATALEYTHTGSVLEYTEIADETVMESVGVGNSNKEAS